MPTITILCPTRARPDGARRTLASIYKTACTDGVRVLFYVAEDDEKLIDYCNLSHHLKTGPHITTCMAWNWLWATAQSDQPSDLYMLGSDDISFGTDGWDEQLFTIAAQWINKPHVFHFRDSRHPTNTPHPIVTRAWTELTGWFMPPIFRHYYVDSFTCWTAKIAGVFTAIPTIDLIHHKETSSVMRFPWAMEWAKEDKSTWSRATSNIEAITRSIVQEVST